MKDFLARIGLGCGRLRGGVEESNSRQVLDAALGCGIRYFDTAPSYGGGASQKILGRGLRGVRSEVQLCTKVGLQAFPPDAAATLRAWTLTTMRAMLPEALLDRLKAARRGRTQPPSMPAARAYGDFEPQLTHSSVQHSLEDLDTEYLDCLLLHEPRPTDPKPEVARVLDELVSQGKALRLGVGTYSQLDDLPAFGDVAQCALGPAVFMDNGPRMLVCHGVLRDFNPALLGRCLNEAGMTDAMPALKRMLADPLGGSALLLNAVLFGTDVQRVLVSSGSPARLRSFIPAAKQMFGEIHADISDDRRAGFRAAARQYFSHQGAIVAGSGTPL